MKRKTNTAGFTLIEIIASLVLAGLLAGLAGLMVMPAVENYLNVQESNRIAQNSQLAMARLSREFMTITNVFSGTSTAIDYTLLYSDGTPPPGDRTPQRRDVSWSGVQGDPLMLEGAPLLNGVRQFSLGYLDTLDGPAHNTWGENSRGIQIVFNLGGSGGTYTNRIFSRNLH